VSDAQVWARFIVDVLTGTDEPGMVESVTEALETFSAAERRRELALQIKRAVLQ
jgi:hypothetical protein